MQNFKRPDPLADLAPGWTPYRYGFNNPVTYIDPDGLFETRAAARQFRRNNDHVSGRVRKQDDGSFAVVNKRSGVSYQDFGDDGVLAFTTISPTDVMDRRVEGGMALDARFVETLRDGTEVDGGPTTITGTAPGPGKILKGAKLLKTLPALDRTGKVHGVLPKIKDLGRYSRGELKTLLRELKQSVQQRIKVTSRKGSDRAHGQRQGAEQDLIKSLEKHLRDRK